jgi:flagellar M-ring protein FliF
MGQLAEFINSVSRGPKVFIALVLLVSSAAFGLLIFWNSGPEHQVLFSQLSQDDAGEMIAKLKERKVPFQVSNSGTTLLVPKEHVYDLRLMLAAEGLPKGGGVGFEVFDRTNLGTTDFVQKLNYQRALQGELGRTIKQIREVEQARVHIVSPKESLFVQEQRKPTASVFLKTRAGMPLAPSQVEGIVHLVATSIEGLEPGNITVVDTSGKILFKRNDNSPIGQLTTTQLDYQRNLEEGLKKKVQGMLEEVLGPNRAIARISTDLDFEQIDITEERYDPNSVIRSVQKQTERSTSNSGPPAEETKTEMSSDGKTTRRSAAQGAQVRIAASQPSNSSLTERDQEVRNYEITRINKHIRPPTGRIKRVSLAVVVDGTYKETADGKGKKTKQYLPRPQEEMKSLENIVKKAIGYDETRGDQVEVINMPFSWSLGEEETAPEREKPWKEALLHFYKPVVSLLLALLFIFFIVRPLVKKGAFEVGAPAALLHEAPQPAALAEAPHVPQKAKPIDYREQALQLVKQDPSKTAGIVKAWLREEA